MKTIWKFDLTKAEITPGAMVRWTGLPKGAEFLDMQVQGEAIVTWWLVEPGETEQETREFLLVGTGWAVPDGVKYLATVQSRWLVWHLFEKL